MEIFEDRRFADGVERFNAGEFREAADAFEDLYFEYTLGERELARGLMQLAVGCLHRELGHRRASVERLTEAVVALGEPGVAGTEALVNEVQRLVADAGSRAWPVLKLRPQRMG